MRNIQTMSKEYVKVRLHISFYLNRKFCCLTSVSSESEFVFSDFSFILSTLFLLLYRSTSIESKDKSKSA